MVSMCFNVYLDSTIMLIYYVIYIYVYLEYDMVL